ncbi:MAG: butyrate kinase [Bacteroidales bacterium]|nr:butyrate kinase [Bacteroidales bacterium]
MFCSNIEHSTEEIQSYGATTNQLSYRKTAVLQEINRHQIKMSELSAVVGRGGMFPQLSAGGYIVDEIMISMIYSDLVRDHASNLGALIAAAIAEPLRIPAFIYDAVSADEFGELARVTGMPEFNRRNFCHVLNTKAMGRKYAAERIGAYEDYNLLIAHLGGGISISAHQKGRIIDSVSDDGGPFSPERSGSLPLDFIVDLCYSGKYTKAEVRRKIRGDGGLKAHLGTADCRQVEAMIANGNKQAKLVYEAMGYQIAKGIGNICTVFEGPIDAIILTGGVAHSKMITDMIVNRVSFIAPVVIYPGENEMESLTLGALRILRGEEEALKYTTDSHGQSFSHAFCYPEYRSG